MLHVCSPYCPPSCPFEPNYVYTCNDENACTQVLTSDQVLYMGTNLQLYGVEPGDSLTTIVDKLVNILYPDCFGVFDDSFDSTFN